MNFVMFTLATDDVFRRCITPISLTSQISDVGALTEYRQCIRTLETLEQASTDLRKIEDWWSITILISTMVSPKDKGKRDMYRYRFPGGLPPPRTPQQIYQDHTTPRPRCAGAGAGRGGGGIWYLCRGVRGGGSPPEAVISNDFG